MSPTLYCFMYVDSGIIPFFLKSRENLYGVSLVAIVVVFMVLMLLVVIVVVEGDVGHTHSAFQRGDQRRDPARY